MDQWNRKYVASFLLDAGVIAMEHYGRRQYEYKYDNTLVTKADIAVETLAETRFVRKAEGTEEGTYLIGEETIAERSPDYITQALSGTTWILDPIDGTSAFANRVPTWGISIALAKAGVITEGAVFIPTTGELCCTDKDGVYYGVAETEWAAGLVPSLPEMRPLLPPDRPFDDGGMISLSQLVTKTGIVGLPNPVHVTASCVYSLLILALGSYVGYLARVKLWDIAGCLPILRNLGCVMCMRSGEPVDTTISKKIYDLTQDSPERFFMREEACFAWTEEAVSAILEAVVVKR